ncbi:MAG: hypothetical protein K8R92_08870 [Planctomycetes bacterium]|nr:hypothetical protein [Planctomycetota bacterium]
MASTEPSNVAPPRRNPTAAAALLAVGVASLLDLATSTSLSLTDQSPSFYVLMFRFADDYSSPVALASAAVAGLLWVIRSPRVFRYFFDLALWMAMIALLDNLVGLIVSLFDKQDNPKFLLLSASLVYLENIAVFTAYYWRFDHIHHRELAPGETCHPGIVFPHHTMTFKTLRGWRPKIVDYLFLSFNTSSTFGPTLPIPLRGSIQLGMMLQVTIAMAVLVMLAARAIGLIS